jgi:ketosteroid isomerase-like protein
VRRFLGSVALVCVFLAGAVAQTPAGSGEGRAPSDAEREVRALVKAMQEAVARRDRAAVERYHAPEFTMIHADGSVETRASWVGQMAKGELTVQKTDWDVLEDEVTFPAPGVAIFTMLVRSRSEAQKRQLCLRSRSVYAKGADGWRAVSAQSTLIHDGPIVVARHDGLPGRYEIGGGRTFTVTVVGGTLFGTNPRGDRMPLFPTAGGDYEGSILSRAKFTFLKDETGRVIGVAMTRDGKEVWQAKRAE